MYKSLLSLILKMLIIEFAFIRVINKRLLLKPIIVILNTL
jgi:hypothetical protein